MSKFRYRFSIGNSGTDGQVGMCFDLVLEQEKENTKQAVEECRRMLSEYGAEDCMTGLSILPQPFGHVCIYLNPANITEEDIESCDELTEE